MYFSIFASVSNSVKSLSHAKCFGTRVFSFGRGLLLTCVALLLQPCAANQTKPLEAEVISVTPDKASKIMISSYHDTTAAAAFPTNAQQVLATPQVANAFAKVRISATVKLPRALTAKDRVKVYFEVEDVDDPSPYPEDTTPKTEWDKTAYHGIELADANDNNANQNGNDNRDKAKNGRLAYETFQRACFPGANYVILNLTTAIDNGSQNMGNNQWKVWRTMNITNRFAGDNYRVRVTGANPEANKYFRTQTKLKNKYKTSGLLTAWKRMYLEIDRMYRRGFVLRADALAGQKTIYVEGSSDLQVNDPVRIFDKVNQISVDYFIASIGTLNTANDTRAYTLTENLAQTITVANKGYVGVRAMGDSTDLFNPDTSLLISSKSPPDPTSFDICFTEFKSLPDGSSAVPKVAFDTEDEHPLFSNDWFKNKNKKNYIHLVGADSLNEDKTHAGIQNPRGITGFVENISYVFIGSTERGYPAGTNSEIIRGDIMHTVCHELIHQFNITSYIPAVGNLKDHDHEFSYDGNEMCTMDTFHTNMYDGLARIGLSTYPDLRKTYTYDGVEYPLPKDPTTDSLPIMHVYKVRDIPDGL